MTAKCNMRNVTYANQLSGYKCSQDMMGKQLEKGGVVRK
jgi:hypothetical protein